LDLGCGDGMVLAKLKHGRYEILLADQLNYVDPRVHFPFRRLREGGLLEIREDFDTVLLLTVLHHSTEPARIVSDLRSLNPQRVVVIESVLDPPSPHNETAMLLAAQDFKSRLAFAVFADWFYNRVLHKDIPVPYNFGCINDWNKLFAEYGFRGKIATNLGLDQSLVPEVHMLLIYERSGG
jgi:2-polyprenyl-3-methyl-5-hydroxy-6-metoxy-1,4-benzoquinol methylase